MRAWPWAPTRKRFTGFSWARSKRERRRASGVFVAGRGAPLPHKQNPEGGGLSEDVFYFLEERRIALRGAVFNFEELA